MLFDDASSQFMRKAASMGAFAVSFWFKPDDLTIDQTMWAQANAAATAYFRVRLLGATGGDLVSVEITTAGVPNQVLSGSAANANAWNHVYAARGVSDGRQLFVSLNGETLQSTTGGTPSGSANTTQLGRMTNGIGAFNQYYSGQMAAFGAWNNCINDRDDRWKALYYGVPPWEIAQDPNDSAGTGLGGLSMVSDTKLMGNIVDDQSGAAAWITSASPTVVVDYPRIRMAA